MNAYAEVADKISRQGLRIDCEEESKRIAQRIRQCVRDERKKRGVVLALSGGIGSSVVAALCVRALGQRRVFGLLLPEKDSSPDTLRLGQLSADHLGIQVEQYDITDILEAAGCYQHRDEAIAAVVPQYDINCKCKLVLPSLLDTDALRLLSLVVESLDGQQTRVRLPLKAYLEIIAAVSFKQRVGRIMEYFHADRRNYAVAGSRDLLGYEQGFFVKQGDGTADLEPIVHLYRTQVYQMAEFLGLPQEICEHTPAADTNLMSQGQPEFYFSVPSDILDICLHGKDHGMAPEEIAPALSLEPGQVGRVFRAIDAKRSPARR